MESLTRCHKCLRGMEKDLEPLVEGCVKCEVQLEAVHEESGAFVPNKETMK